MNEAFTHLPSLKRLQRDKVISKGQETNEGLKKWILLFKNMVLFISLGSFCGVSDSVCEFPVLCLRRKIGLMDQSFGFKTAIMFWNKKEQATSQSHLYS